MTIPQHHLPRKTLRAGQQQTLSGVTLRYLTRRERIEFGWALFYRVTFTSATLEPREKTFTTLSKAREFFDLRVALSRALQIGGAQRPEQASHHGH